MSYTLGNFTAKTLKSINDAIAQDEEGELSLGGRILLIRQLNSLVGARSQNWSEYERRTNEMMKDWARAQGDERSRQYVASRRDTVLLKEDLKKEYREGGQSTQQGSQYRSQPAPTRRTGQPGQPQSQTTQTQARTTRSIEWPRPPRPPPEDDDDDDDDDDE